MRKVEDKTAELVASAAIETIATRQGSCADHQTVAKTLECNSVGHLDWRRNINGLIRQFWPKKRRLEQVTGRSVKRVKRLLNNRPTNSLGDKTPTEVFFGKSLGANFTFQSWIPHLSVPKLRIQAWILGLSQMVDSWAYLYPVRLLSRLELNYERKSRHRENMIYIAMDLIHT